MDFKTDLSNSTFDFYRVVWPELKTMIGGGELITVEGESTYSMCQKLDMLAGIDSWHIHNKYGMRGIGSRIQWIRKGIPPYDTFTIRKKRYSGSLTEYEKRKQAIHSKHGWIYPHLTVQAYIEHPPRSGKLVSIAVVKTKDLITYIEENISTISCKTVKHNGQADFFVINWDKFEKTGYPIEKRLLQGSQINQFKLF